MNRSIYVLCWLEDFQAITCFGLLNGCFCFFIARVLEESMTVERWRPMNFNVYIGYHVSYSLSHMRFIL